MDPNSDLRKRLFQFCGVDPDKTRDKFQVRNRHLAGWVLQQMGFTVPQTAKILGVSVGLVHSVNTMLWPKPTDHQAVKYLLQEWYRSFFNTAVVPIDERTLRVAYKNLKVNDWPHEVRYRKHNQRVY